MYLRRVVAPATVLERRARRRLARGLIACLVEIRSKQIKLSKTNCKQCPSIERVDRELVHIGVGSFTFSPPTSLYPVFRSLCGKERGNERRLRARSRRVISIYEPRRYVCIRRRHVDVVSIYLDRNIFH